MIKFKIRLLAIHKAKRVSVYRVCKDTGLVQNTVRRYLATDEVIVGRLDGSVVQLAKYYGKDWRDIVEVVQVEDEEDPEIQNPLIA